MKLGKFQFFFFLEFSQEKFKRSLKYQIFMHGTLDTRNTINMDKVECRFKDARAMADFSTARKTATMASLSLIVGSFEELAKLLNSRNGRGCKTDLRLDVFCEACSLVSVLFNCLGLAFKFARMEYVTKVLTFLSSSSFLFSSFNLKS